MSATTTAKGLDLEAEGAIKPLAENELRVTYQFKAAREHVGNSQSVPDWRFMLGSATFDKMAAASEILDDVAELALERTAARRLHRGHDGTVVRI